MVPFPERIFRDILYVVPLKLELCIVALRVFPLKLATIVVGR